MSNINIVFDNSVVKKKEIGDYKQEIINGNIPILTFDCDVKIQSDIVIRVGAYGNYPVKESLKDVNITVSQIEFYFGEQHLQDLLTDDAIEFFKVYLSDTYGYNKGDDYFYDGITMDNEEIVYNELDDDDIDYDKIIGALQSISLSDVFIGAKTVEYNGGKYIFEQNAFADVYGGVWFDYNFIFTFDDKATDQFVRKLGGLK